MTYKPDEYIKSRHLSREAVTDAYKFVRGMSVKLDQGITVDLEDILEEEVRARVERIGHKLDILKAKRRATKNKLRKSAYEFYNVKIKE